MKANTPQDIVLYKGYYSESKLWDKLRKQAKTLGLKGVYVVLISYYVLLSDEVDFKQKIAIMGALGYLILPLDLIPDFIPVAGYTDDLAALMGALKLVANNITPTVRRQAMRKLKEFFDDFDANDVDTSIQF